MKRGRDDVGQGGPAKRPPGNAGRPAPTLLQGGNRLTTSDALIYLRDVKNKFHEKKEVYDMFLEIMKEFKAQRIDTAGVIVRVKTLFKGHRELILGFNTFLPKGYEIELTQQEEEELAAYAAAQAAAQGHAHAHQPAPAPAAPAQQQNKPVEFDQAINYVNKIKNRFSQDERVYKAFLEILNMYRKGQKSISNVYEEVSVLFRNHHDLLHEFTYFLPDTSAPGTIPGLAPGPRPAVPGRMPPRTVGPRPGLPPARVVGPGMPSSSGPQTAGLGAGGNQDMRMLKQRKLKKPGEEDEEEPPRAKNYLAREMQLFEKIKNRLRTKEAYQDFLKVLNMFAMEIVNKQELMMLVNDIISRYPDLQREFVLFMERCESMELEVDARGGKEGRTNLRDLQKLKAQTDREKFLAKPLSELVMSGGERCTKSYVKLPTGYPQLTCSGRPHMDAAIASMLNDIWVSVTSGSEDYSFKLMRKNQYEEALFRCEDDRFELDMAIETNMSAFKALQPISEQVAAMSAEDKANFRLSDDSLTSVQYSAIGKIYGDQGSALLELLKRHPAVAVPVVLLRLEQKDKEWKAVRESMNKLWRKVYEQNYHKSLDHRSFYFKQSDKKNLTTRSMLQEIKDAVDKRRQDERSLQALSAAFPFEATLQPDLELDYADQRIHEDVYSVVRYAVEEICGSDSKEAVLEMWLKLVEPFFGIPERADEPHSGVAHTKLKEEKTPHDKDDEDSDDADEDEDKKHKPELTPEREFAEEQDAGDALAALARQAGLEEAAQESSDENQGRAYVGCKPVAPIPRTRPERPKPRNGVQSSVVYGNDNLYYFFRYHFFLFDRLSQARKCCVQKDRPQFRQTIDVERTPEHDRSDGMDPEQQEKADKLHNEFMTMLFKLIDNNMDVSSFEDQCRSLLGTNSYVLFTLDKLITKFVKHMQAMTQDESTCKLWDLYKYESSRTMGIDDQIYFSNCHVILHDDNCFRMEVDGSKLGIQLLDPSKAEIPPSGCEPAFAEYLKMVVASPAPTASETSRKIYLLRNLKYFTDNLEESIMQPEGHERAAYAALQTVRVSNGLECKIACSSRKVSYVLDTEDIMTRLKKFRNYHKFASPKRKQSFRDWHDRVLEEKFQGELAHEPEAHQDMMEVQA